MREYSDLINMDICWKSNAEVLDFDRKYKSMIMGILRKNHVEESICFTLYNDILIKFGRGKLEYDEKIGKFETFLYRIAENAAKDYFREYKRMKNREVALSDQTVATLYDLSGESQVEFEYYREVAIETLKRLCAQNRGKLKNVEIFARRCFADEDVQKLSEEYHRQKNKISLTSSRLHKKYKKIFAEVEREMKTESMKESNFSIDFLESIMDFSLSVA